MRDCSRAAITVALNANAGDCLESDGSLSALGRQSVQKAIGELIKLKGVGPATASAVLTLIRPDLFIYLYDEVIDCFEPKRDYKISNYLRVNSRCLQIAKTLGSTWTPHRVAKTIWTAARFLALNGEDLSQPRKNNRRNLKEARSEENKDGKEEDDGQEDEVDSEASAKMPAAKRLRNA